MKLFGKKKDETLTQESYCQYFYIKIAVCSLNICNTFLCLYKYEDLRRLIVTMLQNVAYR